MEVIIVVLLCYFIITENKFVVKENKKIKGRYEAVILTGKYVLEIDKTGYEVKIINNNKFRKL